MLKSLRLGSATTPSSYQLQHNIKIKFLLATSILLVLGCISSITWVRFTQEQNIAKAQTLVAKVENFSNVSDVDALKAAQKKLQESISILEKVSNIPGSAYYKAQVELATIRPRLDAVEQSIKAAEKLEAAKKLAMEATNIVKEPPHPVAVWQQAKTKWQEAVNLLESVPEGTSISAEVKEKLTVYRSNYTNISQRLEIEPEAKALVNQFSALNSRLDVGMNYHDYSSEVRELKVVLDRFAQKPGASTHPIYESLKSAFKEYNFALDVWRDYIESDESHGLFPASSTYGTSLMQDYQVETHDIYGKEYIHLDTAISAIWERASNNVKEAQGKT